MSTLRDSIAVDPPVTLNANYRLDHVEISRIDDKIRACEEFLVGSLLLGSVSSRFKIFQNTVNLALLKPGACVCLSGASNVLIDAATDVTLAASAQRIIGVLASPGVLGAFMTVVIDGVIPAGLAGVGTGSPGKVYVNGATARLTRTETSYPVGTCDAAGNVQLGGAVSSSSTPSAAHYLVSQPDASLPNAHEIRSTASIEAIASVDIVEWNCIFGETSGTVCQGDDSRLSNARAASSIMGAACKAGSTFSTAGEVPMLNAAGTLEPTQPYSKYVMGSEGSIPYAGADATAGIQFLETSFPNWSLIVDDQGLPSYAPVSEWKRSHCATTAASASSVSGLSLSKPCPAPAVGLPVRIVDRTPIVYSDTYSNYATIFAGLNGTLHVYADARGRIYPSLISDGSGYFHLAFYSDAARTVMFGHTATFNAVGTLAFVPDNGCGLSGTVTIAGTLTANATSILQVFKYLQITAVSGSTLTLVGPALSTGTGNIGAIWIGTPEKIRPLDITIQGAYAGVTTNQAIQDRTGCKTFCDFSEGHLVALRAIHSAPDYTIQPKIGLVHNGGLTVADGSALAVSTSRVSSGTEVIDNKRAVSFGQAIELRAQKLGTGDARGLSAIAIYCLE